jgi:hypothetical protein
MVYIVPHAQGVPRHDLLILDPSVPKDQVRQGFVELNPNQLSAGWDNFRSAYSIDRKSVPRWLSGLGVCLSKAEILAKKG